MKYIIFAFLFLFISFINVQAQKTGIDIFLNETMLKNTSINVKFNNSIDYIQDYLLLSSSNQFYLLGVDGIAQVFEKTSNRIDAFSIATFDSVLIVLSNKSLFHVDSLGNFIKIFDIPNNTTGIASGNDKIYLFDKYAQKSKTNYSLFSLGINGYARLLTMKTPITAVCDSDFDLFFSTNNKLYCVDKQKKTFVQIITLPQEKDTIISIVEDREHQAFYISTKDTIYRSKNNKLEYVCTDFGGILKYDREGLLVFNPEESLIVRFRNNLLYPLEIKKPPIPAIDPANYLSDEKLKELSLSEVRKLVLQNRIGEAIGGYSYLLEDKPRDIELLAEYSYVLALGGVYDCALMNLDRVRLISPQSDEGQFYTSLVFSLMGYEDLQTECIKNIPDRNLPKWISYNEHLKLAETRRKTPQLNQDDNVVTFRRVNYLAATGLCFQSIALYEEIIKADPQEFLPHVGYSVVLEKVGFYRKALQELETGIALMPDSLNEAKVAFEKRKAELSDRINAPQKLKNKIFKLNNDFRPQTMLYAGGMATESSGSFNSRFGIFLNSTFNGAIDFGLSGGKEFFNVNIGVSAYQRFFGFLIWGEGINLQTGKNSTVVSLKSTAGLSFINRNRNSSWDIFFDYYLPLKRETKGMFGISVGKSVYFGTRKERRK